MSFTMRPDLGVLERAEVTQGGQHPLVHVVCGVHLRFWWLLRVCEWYRQRPTWDSEVGGRRGQISMMTSAP